MKYGNVPISAFLVLYTHHLVSQMFIDFFITSGSGNTVFGLICLRFCHFFFAISFNAAPSVPVYLIVLVFRQTRNICVISFFLAFRSRWSVLSILINTDTTQTDCVSNRVDVFEAKANDIVTKLNYCFIDISGCHAYLALFSLHRLLGLFFFSSSYIAFNLFCIFFENIFRFVLFFVASCVNRKWNKLFRSFNANKWIPVVTESLPKLRQRWIKILYKFKWNQLVKRKKSKFY